MTGLTEGTSSPLGATPCRGGVNFSVFSRHASGVELLLFDHVDDANAARVIRLDPAANRTYHYWHVFVPGVTAGQLYGYRVEGPSDPARGMRFDSTKVLLWEGDAPLRRPSARMIIYEMNVRRP
jgi:isoamylase